MRRCDICYTIIPPGQDKCPNCGYHYRPERKVSGLQKEIEKKRYMTQFQPHPSPLDKPSFKRENKPAQVNKKIVLMVIGFTIIGIMMGVFTIVVRNTVNHYHNEIEDVLDWEDEEPIYTDDNFSTFNGLSFGFPEIGNEVQPYYELMLKYFEEEDIYEDYEIGQGQLDEAYISSDIYKEDYAVAFSVYKFKDIPWYQSANIFIESWDFKPEYLSEINQYFEVDDNFLYNQLLSLYNEGIKRVEDVEDTYVFEEMTYGEYELTMALSTDASSKDMSFNIEKKLSE